MGVSAEVGKHASGVGERPLAVDDPLPLEEPRHQLVQRAVGGKVGCAASQLERRRQRPHALQQLGAEDLGHRLDRREELAAGPPPRAAIGQPSRRHHHVHVRVVLQLAAPGVQHGDGPGPGTQPLWVVRERGHRRPRAAEQQPVHLALVAPEDAVQLMGNGEHDVVVADVQKVAALAGHPGLAAVRLALGAVAVAAAVVADELVTAALAAVDVAAEGRRAAREHVFEGLPLLGGEAMGREELLAVGPQDVLDLYHDRPEATASTGLARVARAAAPVTSSTGLATPAATLATCR